MSKDINEWVMVDSISKGDLVEGMVVFISNDPNAYTVKGNSLWCDEQEQSLDCFSDILERGDGKFVYGTYNAGVVHSLLEQHDVFPVTSGVAKAA